MQIPMRNSFKKVSFLVLGVLITFSLNAQNTTPLAPVRPYDVGLIQGNVMLNVNGTMNGGKGVGGSFFNHTFSPQLGYVIANRLIVGGQVGFGKEHFTELVLGGTPTRYPVTMFTQEVFAKYYLLPFRLKPFVQLSLGGNRYKSTDEVVNNAKGYNFFGNAGVGVAFYVRPRFSVEAMYNHRYSKDVLPYGTFADGTLRLGISYFIGNGK